MSEAEKMAALLDITGVALHNGSKGMIALPKPYRHHHLFAVAALLGVDTDGCEQGFTFWTGRFMSRKEAAQYARLDKPEAFSEDLW